LLQGLGAGTVLAYLALVSLVFFLPAVTGLLAAVRAGVESRPAQAIFALSAPCLVAYAASGFYLVSPGVGHAAAITLYCAALVTGAFLAVSCGTARALAALRFWAAPAAMAPAAAGASLGLGFLYGGTSSPLRLAEVRYVLRLANDNVLPRAFAVQLEAATRPLPHFVSAPWLSSDRPPMETSVYVVLRGVLPIGDPHALVYQVLGTLLQSLWMPALWCLLHVVGVPRRVAAGGLAGIAVSGFVLFNSLYVWPKLFPAAFLVLLAALVFTEDWAAARTRVTGGVACGLAAGVAMLGHEGSALALVPLAVVLLARRRRWPRWRPLVAALGTVVALMLPWTLYQRYYAPPGTDLTKLQLAGVGKFDASQGVVSSITSAYEHESADRLWQDKWSNFSIIWNVEGDEAKALGSLTANLFAGGGPGSSQRLAAVAELRSYSFSFFFPTLGLFLLGPLAWAAARWLRRQRGPDMDLAGSVWLFLLVALPLWALVLFGPHSTTNEQGSYAFELLAFGAALIGFWRLSRPLAYVVMALQLAIGVVTYATVNPAHAAELPLPGPTQAGEALLFAVSMLVVAVLPLLAPRPPDLGAPAPEIGGGRRAVAHRRYRHDRRPRSRSTHR
jgi:hypothetical protein